VIAKRRRTQIARLRRSVHAILDGGVSDWRATLVHRVLITLVAASVAAVVLETVADLQSRYGFWFIVIEVIAVTVFSLEYLARLWGAPEHTPHRHLHPWKARWEFARTPSAIIDLLSVLPVYLAFVGSEDFKVLLLLRLLRFFKLARYSAGMRSLVAALEAERKALLASALILLGLVLLAASAMHFAEGRVQPDHFGSIPEAMWWAVVTLTTVGYGDVVPVTLAGRLIASVTMMMGLMMIALPIGIVATAFAEEIHRREFVVTWAMVARVPLFAGLDASSIAEIMRYLRAQNVPAATVIVRRGEQAHSMYFIAAGEVEVELARGPVRLGEGSFFGEIAVLKKTRRTATVRSTQPTKLLALDAGDLHVLTERSPEIGKSIERAAMERTQAPTGEAGDFTSAD
jgi:voltage-gated potassium channel